MGRLDRDLAPAGRGRLSSDPGIGPDRRPSKDNRSSRTRGPHRPDRIVADSADGRPRDLLAAARLCREHRDYARAIVYLFARAARTRSHRPSSSGPRQDESTIPSRDRPLAGVRGLVEQTTLVFEDVFFGHHAIAQPAFEACWHSVWRNLKR